jgi:hexosaminidase
LFAAKMRLIFSFPLLIAAASALWPQPISYQHGDTVLFIKRDAPFYRHDGSARNVGSIADQHPDQQPFVFGQSSDTYSGIQQDSKLRKRYATPFSELQDYGGSQEGVTGDDIIDHAIKSAWKTIFKQNFYPWKFHPRDWEEPSPQGNTAMISEINVNLLKKDPINVAKPLVIE